jgi:hypothetical protein
LVSGIATSIAAVRVRPATTGTSAACARSVAARTVTASTAPTSTAVSTPSITSAPVSPSPDMAEAASVVRTSGVCRSYPVASAVNWVRSVPSKGAKDDSTTNTTEAAAAPPTTWASQ